MAFCNYITYLAGFALENQPIKVPSGYYTEPLKREQTQRELIDKMAQDLSSLPRFHAWIKTLQKKWDEDKYIDAVEKHKIQIMSIEKYTHEKEHKSKPIPLEKFYKLRSEIEEEIAKRQAMWKRGLSSPPAGKKEEKQEADTSKKPPPTGFSTQASGEKENKQEDVEHEPVSRPFARVIYVPGPSIRTRRRG